SVFLSDIETYAADLRPPSWRAISLLRLQSFAVWHGMMTLKSRAGHSGNDGECSEALECCDGQSAGASEVVAVGVCRSFEQSEHTQAAQLTRQPGRREVGQKTQ